jgi:DNA primase
MSATQEIKSRLDIVDVVSDHVALRKSGKTYSGFCPFHPNSRTPAFHVFPDTQTWHCFGACAEGGDLFSFVMKKQGWDFKEALANLAKRAGVTLEAQKPVDKARQSTEKKQVDLLTAAADYYHQLLLHAPQAQGAREYVDQRGLGEDTQALFRLGFALDSWNAVRAHFNGQGYDDEALLAAGLLTEKPETGARYDRFRNRLLIPIRDLEGRVVGFGARTLAKDGIPKYLNSPQTELFNKSRLLYGIDQAKPFIREARHVVIVEGYMDVMQAWQAGYRNVVAQMGTSLTGAQLQLLKRYTKRFILALDADAAGIKATMRGLQVARETLDRETEVRFDARGLVRHEGRLNAEIRIVTLPSGDDPDKIIARDPEQWEQLIDQSRPVVDYVIDVVTRGLDMDEPKMKTQVAQQVVPLIKDIRDPIERDHYWQQLANALGVDERAVRRIQLVEPRRQTPMPDAAAVTAPKSGGAAKNLHAPSASRPAALSRRGSGPMDLRRADFLSQCLQYPNVLTLVNQRLVKHRQEIVSEADFIDAEDKALLRHMYQHVDNRTVVTIEELCDSLDQLLLERVQSLLTLSPAPVSEIDRLPDTLVLSVLDWRLDKTKQLLGEVNKLLREASGIEDNDSLSIYRRQLSDLPLVVLGLNRARDAMSAISRRRAKDARTGQ